MNSYLITGAASQKRQEKIKKTIKKLMGAISNLENHPDILLIKPIN